MKKRIILILSIISFILTFVIADIFSIYSFGTVPTLLTSLYLLSLFGILEYIFISGSYIFNKIYNKEKIFIKKIIGLILLFIALMLIFLFLIVVNVDYLHWYMYSSPFYINVLVRCVEFLVPALILIIISIVLFRKK
jgi:hypothetical protein